VNAVFADTVGLLALWDRSDQWHEAAERAFGELAENRATLFTTSYVLLECANAAARRPYRLEVDRLRDELERGGFLAYPTREEWVTAWQAYSRSDFGGAGVVDNVSFLVMRRLGISRAFTNDRHFVNAGFEVLF